MLVKVSSPFPSTKCQDRVLMYPLRLAKARPNDILIISTDFKRSDCDVRRMCLAERTDSRSAFENNVKILGMICAKS